jgi:hypothetical protein
VRQFRGVAVRRNESARVSFEPDTRGIAFAHRDPYAGSVAASVARNRARLVPVVSVDGARATELSSLRLILVSVRARGAVRAIIV